MVGLRDNLDHIIKLVNLLLPKCLFCAAPLNVKAFHWLLPVLYYYNILLHKYRMFSTIEHFYDETSHHSFPHQVFVDTWNVAKTTSEMFLSGKMRHDWINLWQKFSHAVFVLQTRLKLWICISMHTSNVLTLPKAMYMSNVINVYLGNRWPSFMIDIIVVAFGKVGICMPCVIHMQYKLC